MKNITVIGSGTMGNGIAHVFAQNGFKVNLMDIAQNSLDKAMQTIANNLERSIEVHIIEFDDSIYGMEVEISFIEKIRDEKKYTNLDELKHQLELDKQYVLNLIS